MMQGRCCYRVLGVRKCWIFSHPKYRLVKRQQTIVTLARWCHSGAFDKIKQSDNLILMGSPGSGKTTVGRILAAKLGRSVIDIDNDHLESYWGMTVAEKLAKVGSDNFIKAEGEALLGFKAPKNSVISLTGSNPMYQPAMDAIRMQGTVIFLDVHQSDILCRLEKMKVNRIVGQNDEMSMKDILPYRQQFYEGNYDLRIVCEKEESPESITKKIIKELQVIEKCQNYISTRRKVNGDDNVKEEERNKDFNDVVLEGLATDGGLYIRDGEIPRFTNEQWERLVHLRYPERALRILERWIHPRHVHPSVLSGMVKQVYCEQNFNCYQVFPVKHLQGSMYTTELFHGPTASFKDAALQLLPEFFSHAVKRKVEIGQVCQNDRFLILVATSGDTGSAVLYGFQKQAQSKGVKVMVLYPEEGVSEVQKQQMKSVSSQGVHVLGVNSDFDFCQSAIKKIFNDRNIMDTLSEKYGYKFSAANSINWGRLLPQIVYHASSYLDLVEQKVISMGDHVDLCVPTGNFGNILAAFYAKEMGVPFRRLICASNVNNVLTDFINTGVYDLTFRKLHVTAAPAIDILKSSNLERYLYHISGGNTHLVRNWFSDLADKGRFEIPKDLLRRVQTDFVGDWCTEENCVDTIKNTFKNTGYLLDPHTAVAKFVAEAHNTNDCPLLIAGTAHYAKFAPDVLGAIHGGKHYSDMSPARLLSLLQELKPNPLMHGELQKCIERSVVHETVSEPDVTNIVNELYRFVERS